MIRNYQYFFKKLNFKSIKFDHNVFVFKKKKFIAIYVNDLLIINVDMTYINVIKIKLKERFQMIDLKSTQYYLNIEIIRIDDFIILRQIMYLKKILKRFVRCRAKSKLIITRELQSVELNTKI